MNKIKNLIKNNWIRGVLVLCILSAFATPFINLAIVSVGAALLVGRLVIKGIKKTA